MLQTPDAGLSPQTQTKLDKSELTNPMQFLDLDPVEIPAPDRIRPQARCRLMIGSYEHANHTNRVPT